MKRTGVYVLFAAALLFAGQTLAQSDPEPAAGDREFAERMREAEQRLEEAARRVAELSSERLESMGDIQRFAFAFSDKPRLGVTIDSGRGDQPVEGVSVIGVTPGSAAADAGLRAGDMITSVNGESLSAASADGANRLLLDFMDGVEEGDRLDVEYLRDGKIGKVVVEPRVVDANAFAWMSGAPGAPMARRPDVHVAPGIVKEFRYSLGGWHGAWSDMEVVALSEGLGRYFGTDSGLLVISAPKSPELKLQDGDVIKSIDGREPSSVHHCMRIFASYQPGEKLELEILRDKKTRKIEVEVPDDRSSQLFHEPPRPARPASSPLYVPGPVAIERT